MGSPNGGGFRCALRRHYQVGLQSKHISTVKDGRPKLRVQPLLDPRLGVSCSPSSEVVSLVANNNCSSMRRVLGFASNRHIRMFETLPVSR